MARKIERSAKFRASSESARSLAAFDLDELTDKMSASSRYVVVDGVALRLDPEPANPLLGRTDAKVGHEGALQSRHSCYGLIGRSACYS